VYPLAGFRVDADTLDELTRRSGDCAPREPAPAIPGRSQCRLASQETRRPHRCAGDFDISGMSICIGIAPPPGISMAAPCAKVGRYRGAAITTAP
jgi:hypothetical protein